MVSGRVRAPGARAQGAASAGLDVAADAGNAGPPVGADRVLLRGPRERRQASTSSSRYNDFEKGRTGLLVERVRLFAEVLKLDHHAILTAFNLGKPAVAFAFAQNKFMLVHASAIDELDEETLEAIAAVDSLTVLDAHLQFYAQLAEHGRAQLRARDGKRS